MRHYFLLLLCLFHFAVFAQTSRGDSQMPRQHDTTNAPLQKKDSGYAHVEFRNNELELKRLVQTMDEQEKKEQRRTYTRIILAAVLVTILIVVIVRRTQNRKAGN